MTLGQWLKIIFSYWFYEILRDERAWSAYQKWRRFRRSILEWPW